MDLMYQTAILTTITMWHNQIIKSDLKPETKFCVKIETRVVNKHMNHF